MGLIASSNLPGHKLLHERVCYALDGCHEFQDIDFKESASWEKLKWKIIKTALAMGNLRDGGIIIVGVSERDDIWELTGISQEHLETFDIDNITSQVNAYVSPHVDLTLVTVDYSQSKKFLAIKVSEFSDTPLVCKKNGPNGEELKEGNIYIRSFGKPETTKVTNAQQMHNLLELAAEKRARRILEVSQRIGLVPSSSSTELFNQELKGLDSQIRVPVLQTPHWRVNLRPEYYEPELIPSLSKCFSLIEQNRVKLRGWSYPCENYDSVQGSNWIASWTDFLGRNEYWRFYQSAQFVHLFSIIEVTKPHYRADLENHSRELLSYKNIKPSSVPGFISITNFIHTITEIFEFAARLCTNGIYSGSINITISLEEIEGFILTTEPEYRELRCLYKANENIINNSFSVASDALVANSLEQALKAIVWFVERFGWLDPPIEGFQTDQKILLQRQS